MGYTVTHLDEALPAMWNALSDSFNKDVINGDAETRARWGSYALTQIGLGLLGDKGVSKAAKLAQGAKFSQGISKAGQLSNKGDNLAFAGGNGGRSYLIVLILDKPKKNFQPTSLLKVIGPNLSQV